MRLFGGSVFRASRLKILADLAKALRRLQRRVVFLAGALELGDGAAQIGACARDPRRMRAERQNLGWSFGQGLAGLLTCGMNSLRRTIYGFLADIIALRPARSRGFGGFSGVIRGFRISGGRISSGLAGKSAGGQAANLCEK